MIWSKLAITIKENCSCPPLFVEDISNLLVITGVETFTVEDFSDLEETLSGGGIFYDYIDEQLLMSEEKTPVIFAYFSTDEEGEKIYSDTVKAIEKLKKDNPLYSDIVYSLDTVKDEDWENNWRQYFKPFGVGSRLVVKPTWEELTEDLKGDRLVIEIDPSSSFGTGSHATTKLCMEELEEIIRGDERVLDMGCGSGILTIAAMKLGAGSAVAVDIDEVAARIASDNMRQNGLDVDRVTVLHGDVLSDDELRKKVNTDYDVICANIVAGVIVMMSDLFFSSLKDGGTLIASGIIGEREEEVTLALEKSGFHIVEARKEEDWCVIVAKKIK
ncbi:MAG: 50S ribosomal protein L11 methyltransferase [Ruminococcaceae bacterium]|nr:50S ribosomal protein L11 methyltransferase [Oscillospiraceae bacterium]